MPRTEISSGTLRSVIEYGLPFLTSLVGTARQRLDLLRTDWPQTLQRTRSLSSGHVVRYRCKHRAPARPRVRSIQLDDCRGTDKTASLYTASYYRTFAPRDICLRLRFGDIRVWPGGVMVRALDLRLRRSRVRISAVPLSGNNLGQVVRTSSRIWYRSRGGDAMQLER